MIAEIRWRRPGEGPHFFLRRGSQGGAGSVSVGLFTLAASEAAQWADPATGLACLVAAADDTAVRFTVDDTATALRLAFTVEPQVNGKSCEALTLTQHFAIRNGALVPDQFQTPRYALTMRQRGDDNPVAQNVPSRSATTAARSFLGAHPLLTMIGKASLLVDTEFLDVTNLWWDLHFRLTPKNPTAPVEFNPWYLAPGCESRSGQLAVLVNTRSVPMIWFAAVPEVATGDLPDGTTVGGYLFFRPPGSSPVKYSSNGGGDLAGSQLATTAMATLSRYLLLGRTHRQVESVSMLPAWSQLLGYVGHRDLPLNEANALPCGMEEALHRSSRELLDKTHGVRVLLLPLLSSDIGYGTIPGAGLPERIDAALRLLWCRDTLGGHGQQLLPGSAIAPPQPPQPGAAPGGSGSLRLAGDCWLGSFSRSDALWAALAVPATRARTGRVIAFDTVGLSSVGAPVIKAAARERGSQGLQTFLGWTPYSVGTAPAQLAQELRGLGATVTVLPETGPEYFRMPPNPKAPWLEYIFADNRPWAGGLQPANKTSEWWHQIIAFAGEHLVGDPANPASISFMHATMRP